MTIKDALFRLKELLIKNDDIMDQDDLFEAQDLITSICATLKK